MARNVMNTIKIRPAVLEDAPRLLEIYEYYIRETAVTFEWEVPSLEEFENRIKKISAKFPYFVSENEEGKITGYVYAGSFSERKAYDWTVETSIYLDKDERRNGTGTALYKALEEALQKMGIVCLIAIIAWSEQEDEFLKHDSVLFHGKSGYENSGVLKKVGYKFDRWYDIVMMTKHLV